MNIEEEKEQTEELSEPVGNKTVEMPSFQFIKKWRRWCMGLLAALFVSIALNVILYFKLSFPDWRWHMYEVKSMAAHDTVLNILHKNQFVIEESSLGEQPEYGTTINGGTQILYMWREPDNPIYRSISVPPNSRPFANKLSVPVKVPQTAAEDAVATLKAAGFADAQIGYDNGSIPGPAQGSIYQVICPSAMVHWTLEFRWSAKRMWWDVYRNIPPPKPTATPAISTGS